MGGGGAGLGRGAEADHRAAGDQAGTVARAGGGNRGSDGFRVMAVDPGDRPAAGGETAELVVGHRQAGRAVDGSAVVVEQHDQVDELQEFGSASGRERVCPYVATSAVAV